MRYSATRLHLLSDGTMKQDGGVLFGQAPKAEWEEQVTVDRRNRVTLGINCLLVEMGERRLVAWHDGESTRPAAGFAR